MQDTMDRRSQAMVEQVAALMESSRAAPHDPKLHTEIASLLTDLGRYGPAVGASLIATELAPRNGRAQAELGRALFLAGDIEAALTPCAKAVTLAPRNVRAMVTFSAVLFTLGRLEQALLVASEAVAHEPLNFQARVNLALALEGLGRMDEAEAQSRRTLALEPANPSARHNLAGLRLSRGKLDAESWALYEARLEFTPHSKALAAMSRWSGEDVRGKTILLHAEQGYGDVIQFVRYAPLVTARGARTILAVPGPLVRLLRGMPGLDHVVPAGALPAYDVFCPIASLPGIFGTTLMTIPAAVSYLAADPDIAARFQIPASRELQVGLAWAGNPGFVHDRSRSIDPAALRALQDMPGIRFHNLQKDGVPPFPMVDRMAAVSDFADTAGLIAGLDLVITVDTAVAHLAGALGKPVWMLSRFMGCWRWLRNREDSPWYPTMRIFSQACPGDWGAVLRDVRETLTERTATALRGQRYVESTVRPMGPARSFQSSITGSAA